MIRIRAPELPQDYVWLNSRHPLSLKHLRGRVVLLDFWTYGCINCLHVLPDLKYLEQKYQDHLTVIGVHSGKFDNEQEAANVQQAIVRYNIQHPVIVDRQFRIWQDYVARAYPTLIVIDPDGYIVGRVSGEGHRDTLDEWIQTVLKNHAVNAASTAASISSDDWLLLAPPIADTPLAFPGKVLADADCDRLFIADSGHHRLVVTDLHGHVQQIIGTGQAGLSDGSFEQAQFSNPQGMAFDPQRSCLYVADADNHALRCVNWQTQTVQTIAGTGQQSQWLHPHGGLALEVSLNSPWDVVLVDRQLFVAMAGSHQLWMMDLDQNRIFTYAGTGAEACFDGPIDQAAFAQPSGLTTDGHHLYVADSEGSSVRAVRLTDPIQVETICGSGDLFGFGDVDGTGEQARLQHCLGVTYRDRTLWITDTYNHKLKQVDLATSFCKTRCGDRTSGWQDGNATAARFYEPSGLSIAGSWLYVADTNNHQIRRVDLDRLTVTTLQLTGLCAPTACFPD